MDDESARPRAVPRIADVAAAAGVSTATVSRALSDPDKLRPDTLARVEKAVRRIGYTPNVAARTLRGRRTMVVLVVVPDIANPFFAGVLRGIEETLSDSGYGLLIGNVAHAREKEAKIIDIVLAGQVDGVLLLNGRVPARGGRTLLHAGVPIVGICEAIPGGAFPQVEVQNREAARAAVAHLAGFGHRRIAYIEGPAHNVLECQRHAGYREGLAAARLPVRAALTWPGDFTFAAGEHAAEAFLRMAERPTGVFAANDEMAIGFIKRVRAAGLAVPGDVSVVGFDGIPFADYVDPVLTTFRQPRRELGQVGTELLLRALMRQPNEPEQTHIRLPVPLLARASSGPAPGPTVARVTFPR